MEEDYFNEEDSWKGKKFRDIQDAINLIEKSRPFDEDVIEYREIQIKYLKMLLKRN